MPDVIKKITKRYLKNPEHIKIQSTVTTEAKIRQRYCQVAGHHKLEALTRIMEVEEFDGMIIFVRTKTATLELAEKLSARGHDVEALNGDIQQSARERTVERLKQGKIDVLVATDVVARGLDVERVSHVINYDIPYDTESYVHRIGRTGRAGRTGDAILFISHREKRLLFAIEKMTKQVIEKMDIPSISQLNESRLGRFKTSVLEALNDDAIEAYMPVIEAIMAESESSPERVMAALAKVAQGNEPLLLNENEKTDLNAQPTFKERSERDRGPRNKSERSGGRGERKSNASNSRPRGKPESGMQRFRIEVGYTHGAKPGNIVGAIANEANISSKNIGAIDIHDSYSLVDLPDSLGNDTRDTLQKTRVAGQRLNLRPWSDEPPKRKKRT
jgi:ATP-dependent RNA helicase DeaD